MYIYFARPLYGREEQYHEVQNPPEIQNKFTQNSFQMANPLVAYWWGTSSKKKKPGIDPRL